MPQNTVQSPKPAPTGNQINKLMRYLVHYWKQMAIAATSLTIWSLIGLALPWAIQTLVDSFFITHNLAQLDNITFWLLILFLIQAVIGFVQNYLLIYVAQRVIADLRMDIQEHMLWLPLGFFSNSRVGELVSRVTNDVAVIQQALTEVPISMLRQVVTIAGGLVLMLILNWQMTLFVFLLAPFLVVTGIAFGQRLERISVLVQDRLATATSVLEEAISGIRVVKSFTKEKYEQKRFADRIEETFQTVMKRTQLRAAFLPIVSMLGLFTVIAILWFGGRQVIIGNLTPGKLVSFLIYMMMVAAPIGEFAGQYSQLKEASGASTRIFEILETRAEPVSNKNLKPLPRVNGYVSFKDINFSYEPGGELVLKNINLEIKPAQIVAIVGPSGVGKTTLVNLIPRFFDPSSGHIEIDGININDVDLRSLRAQIGLVPQETFLFGGTIRENIAYGRPNAKMVDIERVAKAAYAHNFIKSLPDGYDTASGERGIKLSAGQRQRIAIARALLKDPRILILDEATSALDTESEHEVQDALDILMKGRTTFVIAHRLSTIQNADRILVLNEGKISEDGSHKELMAKRQMYYRLWSLQFADNPNHEKKRQKQNSPQKAQIKKLSY
jgi:subfamily B ATP-binding cassette protein MsbA